MIEQVKKLFFTQTSKDTVIVFAGTIINAVIGGVFFILAPRILGPGQYGLFAVVMSTGVMAAGLANLGIDTGILRFIQEGMHERNQKILKLAFELYLWVGLIIFGLGLLIAGPLAIILGIPMLAPLLRIAFSGVIFILLTNFFIATLQSRKQFLKASVVNIASNSVRLVILVFAAYFFTINVYFLTILFFFVAIISLIVGKLLVPLDFLKAKNHYREFGVFFTYNSWIAASFAVSLIPIDNYMLLKFAGPVATGIYAAPLKILSVVDQLSGNFSSVLASRLTSFDSRERVIDFLKKTSPVVFSISIIFLISVVLAEPIVKFLLGGQFLSSIGVFKLIAFSSVFTFANAIPVSLILYYFKRSRVVFINTIVAIFIWLLTSILLIPKYHALGAAWAYSLTEVAAFVLFISYVIWKFSKKENGAN